MLQSNMNNIEDIVNNTNIKLTDARKSILEILSKSTKPICYEEIKDLLSMDKATFYRNISKFEEESIIDTFESNDKRRYFEIKKTEHSHFICNSCSKIECLHEDINLKIPNYKIENIIIKGICPSCL